MLACSSGRPELLFTACHTGSTGEGQPGVYKLIDSPELEIRTCTAEPPKFNCPEYTNRQTLENTTAGHAPSPGVTEKPGSWPRKCSREHRQPVPTRTVSRLSNALDRSGQRACAESMHREHELAILPRNKDSTWQAVSGVNRPQVSSPSQRALMTLPTGRPPGSRCPPCKARSQSSK